MFFFGHANHKKERERTREPESAHTHTQRQSRNLKSALTCACCQRQRKPPVEIWTLLAVCYIWESIPYYLVKTFANGCQSYHSGHRAGSKCMPSKSIPIATTTSINRYIFCNIESHSLSISAVKERACKSACLCVRGWERAREPLHTYTRTHVYTNAHSAARSLARSLTHSPLNQAVDRTCCACYASSSC